MGFSDVAQRVAQFLKADASLLRRETRLRATGSETSCNGLTALPNLDIYKRRAFTAGDIKAMTDEDKMIYKLTVHNKFYD